MVKRVLIEQFPIPPKETKVEPAPITKPPKVAKTEEEENVEQFFSTVQQPEFFVDGIPVSLDTSQDVEDLFKDTTKFVEVVQVEEAHIAENPVENETK